MTNRKNGSFHPLAAFAAAGLVGAGIALLLAPRSGRETRRALAQFGGIAREKSKHLASGVGGKLDSFLEDMGSSLESHLCCGKSWSAEKREELEQALQSGKQFIEKEVNKVLRS
jgi:gas vesicle protein